MRKRLLQICVWISLFLAVLLCLSLIYIQVADPHVRVNPEIRYPHISIFQYVNVAGGKNMVDV